MVGGAVTRPTATTEPDMKPFDTPFGRWAGFSLHPALQKTGSCHEHFARWTSSRQ